MLDQPAQQNTYSNLEHQQHDLARQEAEALFRPKPKLVEHITPPQVSTDKAPVRKPRILSAVPPSANFAAAEMISAQQDQQTEGARTNRDRLGAARKVIVRQQQVLWAKLETIEAELRGIAAYETAKQSGGPIRRCVR